MPIRRCVDCFDTNSRFTGSFNGNGFTISNFTFGDGSQNNAAMFGDVRSGDIFNLDVANVNINGNSLCAGLVANTSAIRVLNVSISGTVVCAGNNVGMLLGR